MFEMFNKKLRRVKPENVFVAPLVVTATFVLGQTFLMAKVHESGLGGAVLDAARKVDRACHLQDITREFVTYTALTLRGARKFTASIGVPPNYFEEKNDNGDVRTVINLTVIDSRNGNISNIPYYSFRCRVKDLRP